MDVNNLTPLISCVMATRNRRHFLSQALRCFLRQTYPNKELIVVDDSIRSNERLCRDLPNVRYLRLAPPVRTGTKLNIGIEAARGDILHKLDDDDYYHPEFLATSIAHLPAARPDRTLVARCCFLVLLPGDPVIRHSGDGWTAGGTLCFHRAMWNKIPFREVRSSVDSHFIRDHQPTIVEICRPEQYLLVRHGENTWSQVSTGDVDEYFNEQPPYAKSLEEIVPARDLRFYRALIRTGAARARS